MRYVEITLLPAMEVSQAFLLSKLFMAIHTRLVELKDEKDNVGIGISFPEYSVAGKTLGTKIRLIAEKRETLETFDVKTTLKIYTEYAHFTGIREVPEGVSSHVQFTRVQPPATLERLARRKAKRMSITYEEAVEKISQYAPNHITLPYVLIRSKSSNKGFSLFVKKIENHTTEQFTFNTYGLSKGGTVPEF